MSNYDKYLLKFVATNEIFPMSYIQYDTWESEPNHREEVKAYRDDYTRNLTRVPATGMKSSFAFSTRDNLKLEDREIIKDLFDRAYAAEYSAHYWKNQDGSWMTLDQIKTERKVRLKYWNDEDLAYKTGDFYIPNNPFKIKVVKGNTLVYNSCKMEFVEY